MSFLVRVRDFQSIGETVTIEVNGFTVITGPNNVGKTALMRAIFGLCSNARGNSFVRYGKESARVEIEFQDKKVAWEKGLKVNRYEVDGKAIDRVGAGVPDEVSGLGIGPIEAAGRELWPQFAHQFVGQIFLLDLPGSVLAEAIANVDKVGVLNEALRLSQSDRKSTASDLKLRSADVAKNEEALSKFDGLDSVVEKVREVVAKQEGIVESRKTYLGLKGYRDRLSAANEVVFALEPVRRIPELPAESFSRIQKVNRARIDLLSYRDRYENSRKTAEILQPARQIASPTEEQVARIRKISQASDWTKGAKQRLEKAESERGIAETATERLSRTSIPEPRLVREALERLTEVRTLSEKWKAAQGSVETLTVEVSSLTHEHSEAEKELSVLFQQSGRCPYCGVPHENSSC
jgi:exonuclease SbcC